MAKEKEVKEFVDQPQINENLRTILNDTEFLMAKADRLLGADTQFDGLKRELRRARDNTANLLGLARQRNGTWAQP